MEVVAGTPCKSQLADILWATLPAGKVKLFAGSNYVNQANKKVTLRSSVTENLFSQWGEESVVSQLLNVTRDSKMMTLVEFGGFRGPEYSNFLRFATLGCRVVETS